MRLLALETSTRHGSVALWDGGLLEQRTYPPGLRHASGLVKLIDALCTDHGWTPGDIERVAVSIGPGSFTGVRVGLSAAKMLALAIGCELVAVPSLRVIAEQGLADRVAVALDARKGRVILGTFDRRDGTLTETSPPAVVPLSALDALPPGTQVLREEVTPTAADVAKLAVHANPLDPVTVAPHYVRRPEPEEKRLGIT